VKRGDTGQRKESEVSFMLKRIEF